VADGGGGAGVCTLVTADDNVTALRLIADGECKATTGGVMNLDCSPDGSKLLACTTSAYIELFDAKTMRSDKVFRTRALEALFVADGQQLVISRLKQQDLSKRSEDVIKVIKRDTEEVLTVIPGGGPKADRMRNVIAFQSDDWSKICVYDFKTGQVTHRWKGDDKRVSSVLSISPGGEVGINSGDGKSVLLWLPPYDDQPIRFERGTTLGGFCVSPNGRFAVLGTNDRVEIWDVSARAKVSTLDMKQGEKLGITALRFLPDGKHLVSVANGGELVVWETETFREVVRQKAHSSWDCQVVVFPKDNRFATAGGDDGLIKIWKLDRPAP